MADQGWFTIEEDDDGHCYVVPLEKRNEFKYWVDDITDYWVFGSSRPDAEEEPQPPEGVERVQDVRFRDWEHQ